MTLNETQLKIRERLIRRGIGANHPRVLERIVRLNANRKEGDPYRGVHHKPSTKYQERSTGDVTIRGFAEVHGWEAARNLPKAWKYKLAGRKFMVTRETLEDWSQEWQERMFQCHKA